MRSNRKNTGKIEQVRFTQSPEIVYWAKKHNLTPSELETAFVESNFSMIKAIELCAKNKAA